jgi:Arc/MetJ-type ribon-helix-helix transcriptional regulator
MGKSIMLRIRVEPEFKSLLQKAIAEGKAESMSELIRKAVFEFLEGAQK